MDLYQQPSRTPTTSSLQALSRHWLTEGNKHGLSGWNMKDTPRYQVSLLILGGEKGIPASFLDPDMKPAPSHECQQELRPFHTPLLSISILYWPILQIRHLSGLHLPHPCSRDHESSAILLRGLLEEKNKMRGEYFISSILKVSVKFIQVYCFSVLLWSCIFILLL